MKLPRNERRCENCLYVQKELKEGKPPMFYCYRTMPKDHFLVSGDWCGFGMWVKMDGDRELTWSYEDPDDHSGYCYIGWDQ